MKGPKTPEKNNKGEGSTLPDIKTYQENRIQSLEGNLHIYGL